MYDSMIRLIPSVNTERVCPPSPESGSSGVGGRKRPISEGPPGTPNGEITDDTVFHELMLDQVRQSDNGRGGGGEQGVC